MDPLTPARRRELRAEAHHLHPVVTIGNRGLTPAVLHEIDLALTAHELVKLRVANDDREERSRLFVRVCTELRSAPVQQLGKLLIVWRERPPATKEAAATRRDAAGRGPEVIEPIAGRRRNARDARTPKGVPRATTRRRRRG